MSSLGAFYIPAAVLALGATMILYGVVRAILKAIRERPRQSGEPGGATSEGGSYYSGGDSSGDCDRQPAVADGGSSDGGGAGGDGGGGGGD